MGNGNSIYEKTLLDGVIVAGNGTWIDVSGWGALSIHIKGINGDTVELHGSCEPTKPADATDGILLNTFNANGILHYEGKLKYVKCKTTIRSAGTIYAYAIGQRV